MNLRIGAHRGAMGHVPENTLAAFTLAVEQHTWRIECDVRRTADGALVMLHDDTVDRTTAGHGAVAELTFAAIRQLRAGSETIPTLSETLETARGRVRWLVEIKDSAAVDDVVTVIRSAGLTDVCTISCFDEVVLARVKELCPALATAWFHLAPGPLAAAELVARLGVELLIVWPPAAHPEVIAAALDAGMAIRSGLPDNLTYEQTAAEVRRMVALGIPEISCGRPDWIGRAFGELEGSEA